MFHERNYLPARRDVCGADLAGSRYDPVGSKIQGNRDRAQQGQKSALGVIDVRPVLGRSAKFTTVRLSSARVSAAARALSLSEDATQTDRTLPVRWVPAQGTSHLERRTECSERRTKYSVLRFTVEPLHAGGGGAQHAASPPASDVGYAEF